MKRVRKSRILIFIIFLSLIISVSINITSADENDNMTKAERELNNIANISDEDINAKIPQFTKDYLENEKEAQEVIDTINDNFVNKHDYYQNDISTKNYEEIKKEYPVIPDQSIQQDYCKSYPFSIYTYQNQKVKKMNQLQKTIIDTPVYNGQLTHSYWKEAYCAYKTYSQFDESTGLNDNELFANYYKQFLNALKNEDGFFKTSIKAHVNTLYYKVDGEFIEQTDQEAFNQYKKDLLEKSKAEALINQYQDQCRQYNKTYLSQEGFDHYLKSINNTRDTWKFKEYCSLAKKGILSGIPAFPHKPENYNHLIKQAHTNLIPVEMHQQFTYTLCQNETPQVLNTLNNTETPQDKVLSWAYQTIDSLTNNSISFQELTVTPDIKNTYRQYLQTDYDQFFINQKNEIIDSLKSKRAYQYRLLDYGRKISNCAYSKLGCLYYWGASGEDMFDCSGLVYWVMNHSGIHIERLTANDYAQDGNEIQNIDDMIPGDVIALGDDDSYGHIGIYVGHGKVIEAMGEGETCKGNHPQHVVKTTELNHFIHEEKKYMIRRLF